MHRFDHKSSIITILFMYQTCFIFCMTENPASIREENNLVARKYFNTIKFFVKNYLLLKYIQSIFFLI